MSQVSQWKTAVSTSHTDLAELQHMKACGIQGMELSVAYTRCLEIDWQGLRQHADEAGIEILSYHLPFSMETNIASPDEEKRQWAVDFQKKMLEKAASIGIKRFVIHPSAEPVPLEAEERALWIDAAKRSLQEMVAFAAQYGAVICVEDLPRSCLGHTPDEMLELLSADERLRVCFDVNHLLTCFGCTHQEFIEKLGHKIVTTHMSDYDFVDEKHFFPGYGMLNWKAVVEGLEQADYQGPFLYEGGFSPSPRMPDVPFGRLEDARERHLRIKELTGKNYVGK